MDKLLTFKLYLTDLQSEDVDPKTINTDVKSVFTNYFSKSGEFNESMKNLTNDFEFVKSEPLEFVKDGVVVRILFKTSSEEQDILDALEVWGEKTATQVDEILNHGFIMNLIVSGRSAPTVETPEENPEAPDTDPTTPGGRRRRRKTRKGRKNRRRTRKH